MTLLSHICSKSGVIMLISAMLLSPVCCPPFIVPVISPLLVHHPTPTPCLFVFPTVPCPQWTPCHLLALVFSGVHQLHHHQHHHLPLQAVARRQGGGAAWCGIGCSSSVVSYHHCGWCHIIIVVVVVVVVVVALSSRNRTHCHPASRGLQWQCGVHCRCQLQSLWSRNRPHFHPVSSGSQQWHRAWVRYC